MRVGRGVERGRGDPTGGPGAVRRDPDGLAHAGDGRVGDDGGAAGAGAGAGARPTAIIAQTASAMAGGRERCSGEGMDDFLAKPLSMEALRAVSERWATVSLATDEIGH